MEGINWKEQEGVSSDDGNVLHLDDYMGAYICQNSLNCALNICAFPTYKFYRKNVF